MRHTLSLVVSLGLCAAFGQAQLAAQPTAPPSIQRVTVRPDTGVLTISGTGLGPDLMVMVDGHPWRCSRAHRTRNWKSWHRQRSYRRREPTG